MTSTANITGMSLTPESTVTAEIVNITTEVDGIVSLYLRSVDGMFPTWMPGAHIDLHLGSDLVRQYSLCGDRHDPANWRVAVLREPKSRGGSDFVHDNLSIGDYITCSAPRNNFNLVEAPEYLFIAGGIGITPLLPMIHECERRGAKWHLVYGGRSETSMAFTNELETFGDKVTFWPEDKFGLIDLPSLLTNPKQQLAVYCCGPGVLLDAVEEYPVNWPKEDAATLHIERFRPQAGALDGPNSSFEIVIDSNGQVLTVQEDKSIVETLESAGYHVPTSCREGTCGTCETVVLDGVPDHRDSYLTPGERDSNEVMMTCCSRACSKSLTLDL